VHQAELRRFAQDLEGLLARDLASQVVLHDVPAQVSEVQADLGRVLAIRGPGIEVLPLLAGAMRDGEVVERLHELDHVLVGQDLPRVGDGLLDR
jgi:hypothetical protein